MYVEIIVRFDCEADCEASGQDVDSLRDWLQGTIHNGVMDESVGFPNSIEGYGQVLDAKRVRERPKA